MRFARALVVLSGLITVAGGLPTAAQTAAQPRGEAKARRPQVVSQPIQVYDARFENGDLRISGSVRKPGTVVVLDEYISIIADSRGRFVFRLPYVPTNCIATLKAVREGRAHGLSHQLINSPIDVVAVEVLAKWIHPELFADLNPRATLDQINQQFLAVPYRGAYWADLTPA